MDNLFYLLNYLSCVPDFSYARRCFGLVIAFSSFLYPLFCCLCLTSICVAYAHMGDVFHISDETFLYKNEVGELGMNLFFTIFVENKMRLGSVKVRKAQLSSFAAALACHYNL